MNSARRGGASSAPPNATTPFIPPTRSSPPTWCGGGCCEAARSSRGPRSARMVEPGANPPRSSRCNSSKCVNGIAAAEYSQLTTFNDLTVVDPKQRIMFETRVARSAMRVVDLMTPIGRGQRGLIAAPPRTGKTILLQQMAAGDRRQSPRHLHDGAADRRAARRSDRDAPHASTARWSSPATTRTSPATFALPGS